MASSVHRIEVHYHKDPRLKTRTDRIRTLGFLIEELHLVDVYTIATDAKDFTREELQQIGSQLMNPVVQECLVDEPTRVPFDHRLVGTWAEDNGASKGPVEFDMTPDGKNFAGWWGYEGEDLSTIKKNDPSWTGIRVS